MNDYERKEILDITQKRNLQKERVKDAGLFSQEKKICNNCIEIMEIYAGMEGFKPKYATEEYLLHIIRQMYDCTKK